MVPKFNIVFVKWSHSTHHNSQVHFYQKKKMASLKNTKKMKIAKIFPLL